MVSPIALQVIRILSYEAFSLLSAFAPGLLCLYRKVFLEQFLSATLPCLHLLEAGNLVYLVLSFLSFPTLLSLYLHRLAALNLVGDPHTSGDVSLRSPVWHLILWHIALRTLWSLWGSSGWEQTEFEAGTPWNSSDSSPHTVVKRAFTVSAGFSLSTTMGDSSSSWHYQRPEVREAVGILSPSNSLSSLMVELTLHPVFPDKLQKTMIL